LCADAKMTSNMTIEADMKNAGANWVEKEVVLDNGFVASRKPDDLAAYNAKSIQQIAGGVHSRAAMKA